MSNVPYVPPGTQVVVQQQPSNGLGVAGFVTSLIGVVTCGLLSPIGLLFSIFGLMKRPRGLAIAGTILGALGSLWLVMAGFTLVAGFVGLSKAVNVIAGIATTQAEGRKAAEAIWKEKENAGGKLPNQTKGDELVAAHLDAWKHPLHYKLSGETFSLVSDGPDGKPDTSDDITFSESELRTPVSTTAPSGSDSTTSKDESSDSNSK